MLPRSRRIPGYKVKQLLSAPVVKRTRGLTIKAATNDLTHPRFAVVVPKKVAHSAVARNRLKRQMMASIETHLNDYEAGKDYLFLIYEIFGFKID
ncbi:MAG TPA: ribonuclease P protein component [Patescibacteria group bacterium]|nr:ribonuclease P protein component [Patescibacteria group bacterium]